MPRKACRAEPHDHGIAFPVPRNVITGLTPVSTEFALR